MSRDWTPREMYAVEQYNIRNGLGSWWDHMKNSVWVLPNGERIPLCTEENFARRQEYPLMGRLYECYDEIYTFLSQLDGGMDLLKRYESALDVYIQTGQGDKESPLIQWFEGELDKSFYYSERNDELLLSFIRNEALRLSPPTSSQEINNLEFIFDEEITVSDDNVHLEGYVWATDALVARLTAQEPPLTEDQFMENINFYPVYDPNGGTVSLEGHYYLEDAHYTKGKAFTLPLSHEESAKLISGFEQYCQNQEGLSCTDFLNYMRKDNGLSPIPKKSLAEQLEYAQERAGDPQAKEVDLTR